MNEDRNLLIRNRWLRVQDAARDGSLSALNPDHNAKWDDVCWLLDRLEAAEGRIVELRETLQALVVETAAWEFLGIYGVGSTDPVYLAAVDVLRKERKHETTRRA